MPTRAQKRQAQAAAQTAAVAPPPAVVQTAQPTTTDLPVLYDKTSMVEYSTTSEAGPLTATDLKKMLGWETEKDYQRRMVKENPGTQPEHYLYGDIYHCLNSNKEKVRCSNNANNRPFDPSWCEDLTHTVCYGHWAGPHTVPGETINGETIRVSKYGRVLSGQHQGTACILADECLQRSRAVAGNVLDPKYPAWNGQAECFIETIVVYGLSEDERVLRTIDYVKPRSVADMLFTMQVYRENLPVERKEMTRMLASAIDLLWLRTDTKGYKTHPEIVGFLERHKKLLDFVEHIFRENAGATDTSSNASRRISKLRLNAGHCAALCYLMGCSGEGTDGDVYRNGFPPSESVVGLDKRRALDWEYELKAVEFWSKLAGDRGFIPVRAALGRLVESSAASEDNLGMGGRLPEKLAILANAWEIFREHPDSAGPPFTMDDLAEDGALCLEYNDLDDKGFKLPDGQIKLIDCADFMGIDCPENVGASKSRGAKTAAPMPPAPSRDEIMQAAEDARARRLAAGTR